MTVPAIHEDDAEELGLPGRRMRWLVSKDAVKAKNCSTCVIRVSPGEKVTPAHSHPNGEEVIYIMTGSGRVLVAGEVRPVQRRHRRAVSAGRRAHAPQHRKRRDEGRLLLRSRHRAGQLPAPRRRGLPGLTRSECDETVCVCVDGVSRRHPHRASLDERQGRRGDRQSARRQRAVLVYRRRHGARDWRDRMAGGRA